MGTVAKAAEKVMRADPIDVALLTTCRQPFEAKTLIDFLTGVSAKSVYRMKGMDPG
jgi:hypothetical protein